MDYEVIRVIEINNKDNKYININKYAILKKEDKFYLQLKLYNKSEYEITKFKVNFINNNIKVTSEFNELSIFPYEQFFERTLIEIQSEEIENLEIIDVFGKKVIETKIENEQIPKKEKKTKKEKKPLSKNKKTLIGILTPIITIALVILCVPRCEANGSEFDPFFEQGVQYVMDFETGGYCAESYEGTHEKVIILDEINGYPVTSLSSYIFEGNEFLKEVSLPDCLKKISDSAFSGCYNLSKINFPNSLEYIGQFAFYGCEELKKIVIPESVTYIEEAAFAGCYNLIIYTYAPSRPEGWIDECIDYSPVYYLGEWEYNDEEPECFSTYGLNFIKEDGAYFVSGYEGMEKDIIIPSFYKGYPVEGIKEEAFRYFNDLTSVVISEGITSIGEHAFEECKSLTSVVIPEGVTGIESGVFLHCENLMSIELPSTIEYIEMCAFFRCVNLKNISIPEGVEYIGAETFFGCENLTNIEIPEGVTSIGNAAFAECISLTSVKLPSTLKSIGYQAFRNCSSLESIIIPESVITIGIDAFYGCINLEIFCEASSEPSGWAPDWNFGRPVYWAGEW